jgi:hypothetical protein
MFTIYNFSPIFLFDGGKHTLNGRASMLVAWLFGLGES